MNNLDKSTIFYEELKKNRVSQDIQLTEISNRTKINLEYLESIENGDFYFLPYIYVRLFLRAYCIEIGSNIEDSLQQLDHTMNKKTVTEEKKDKIFKLENAFDKINSGIKLNNFSLYNISKKNLYNILFLLLLLVFGIMISRNLVNDENKETEIFNSSNSNQDINLNLKQPKRITDSDLTSNYYKEQSIKILNLNSPFEILITSQEEISLELIKDYSNQPYLTLLHSNNNLKNTFKKNISLRLEKTKGIEVRINNQLIDIVKSNNPKELFYNTSSKELKIIYYLPK